MERRKKHIVCLSGGKESSYLLIWLLENGYPVDECIHAVVLATEEMSAEYPQMEEYFDRLQDYTGVPIRRIVKNVSFEKQFYARYENGKKKGQIYGFPYTIGAWCQDRLKAKLLDSYFSEQKEDVIYYVGISAGEEVRYNRLSKHCRAPLYENGIYGEDCLRELRLRGLENPLYQKFKRLGCWFCPKQGLDSLRKLYHYYPDLWQLLLKWDADSPVPFKPSMTVADLDYRFRLEDESGYFYD